MHCYEYQVHLKFNYEYIISATHFPQELLYIGVAGAAIFGMEKGGQMQLHSFYPPQKFDNIVQQDMLDVRSSSRLCIQQITTQ